MIWQQQFTIEGLNQMQENSLGQHIGIKFTDYGEDYLEATMPVDQRTHQPMGLLHGGASAVLAETLGSVGGTLCLKDLGEKTVVGIEINANHIKGVRSGIVTGRASPIRIGRNLHVWEIKIVNEENKTVCVSRLTLMVIPMASKSN